MLRFLAGAVGVAFAILPASAATATNGPVCGATITADTVLRADLSCPADGLSIAAPGVTLDLNGHTVSGPGVPAGVFAGVRVLPAGAGATVRNGQLRGFYHGVFAGRAAHRVRLEHLTLADDGNGAWLESDGNTISANQIVNADTGIYLPGNDSVVEANSLVETGAGMFVSGRGHRIASNRIKGDETHEPGIVVLAATATQVSGNVVSGHPNNAGITVRDGSGNVVSGNQVARNGTGIVVTSPGTLIAGNLAAANRGLGIDAGAGSTDGGGNRAAGNGDPAQCRGVRCSAS